jgi:hypothetical protein
MPKAKTARTSNGKAKTTTAPEIQAAATSEVTTSVVSAEPAKEATNTIAKIETAKADLKAAKRVEVRKNVFPINLDEEIRRRAYELSEQRGFLPGHENEDWLRAEREILAHYTAQQTA